MTGIFVVAVIAVVAAVACNACNACVARNAAGPGWVQRRNDVDQSHGSGRRKSFGVGPQCAVVIGSSLQAMMQRRGTVVGVEGVGYAVSGP